MTTTPPLRPMSLGDMFDAAFKLYRRHFLTFIGIVALLQVPMAIVQFLVQLTLGNRALQNWVRFAERVPVSGPGQNPLDIFPFGDILTVAGIGIALSVVQFLFVRNLVTGALANAIARSYNGQPVSILDAYRFGPRRFLALIGASLATFVVGAALLAVIFGCSFGSIFALAGSGNRTSGAIAAILVVLLMLGLFVLLGLGALFVYSRLLVTTQAIVLEDRGPIEGIRRSWRLVGGAFWRALGVMVLMGLLTYLIAQFPASIISFGITLASGGALDSLVVNQVITTLLYQIGEILALPLQLAVYTLLYYDLRVRKEGYDLELRVQQAEPAELGAA
jgi:hypothetical protein